MQPREPDFPQSCTTLEERTQNAARMRQRCEEAHRQRMAEDAARLEVDNDTSEDDTSEDDASEDDATEEETRLTAFAVEPRADNITQVTNSRRLIHEYQCPRRVACLGLDGDEEDAPDDDAEITADEFTSVAVIDWINWSKEKAQTHAQQMARDGYGTRLTELPPWLGGDDCPLLRQSAQRSALQGARCLGDLYTNTEAIPGMLCKADRIPNACHFFSCEPSELFGWIMMAPRATHFDEQIRGRLPLRFFMDIDRTDPLAIGEGCDDMINEIIKAAVTVIRDTTADDLSDELLRVNACTSHKPGGKKYSYHLIFSGVICRHLNDLKTLTGRIKEEVEQRFSPYIDPAAGILKGLRCPWSCKKDDPTREMTPAFRVVGGVRTSLKIDTGTPFEMMTDNNRAIFLELLVQPPAVSTYGRHHIDTDTAPICEPFTVLQIDGIDHPDTKPPTTTTHLTGDDHGKAVALIARAFPNSKVKQMDGVNCWSILSAKCDVCPVHESQHSGNNGYAKIGRDGVTLWFCCYSKKPARDGSENQSFKLGTIRKPTDDTEAESIAEEAAPVPRTPPKTGREANKCEDPEKFHRAQSRAMASKQPNNWGNFTKGLHRYSDDTTITIDDGKRVRIVVAPLMTGKTTAERNEIDKLPANARIVWVSYRKSLTTDTLKTLESKGFRSYNVLEHTEGLPFLDLERWPRWIIQLESLRRLLDPSAEAYPGDANEREEYARRSIQSVDLLVIDEANAVIRQAGELVPTGFKLESVRTLFHLMHTAKAVHCLDGLMTYDVVEELHRLTFEGTRVALGMSAISEPFDEDGDDFNHIDTLPSLQINTVENMTNKRVKFHQNRDTIRTAIKAHAVEVLEMSPHHQQRSKFFISCGRRQSGASSAEGLQRWLIDGLGYQCEQVAVIDGMTDDQKKQETFQDVGAAWESTAVLCVIYTCTIEAGVSYEVRDSFSRGFAFCDNSCIHVEAFTQMMFRIRDCHQFDVYTEISSLGANATTITQQAQMLTENYELACKNCRNVAKIDGQTVIPLTPFNRLALLNRARLSQSKNNGLPMMVRRFRSWGISVSFCTLLAAFGEVVDVSEEIPADVIEDAEHTDGDQFAHALERIDADEWAEFIKAIRRRAKAFGKYSAAARMSNLKHIGDDGRGVTGDTCDDYGDKTRRMKNREIAGGVVSVFGGMQSDQLFNPYLTRSVDSKNKQYQTQRLQHLIKTMETGDTSLLLEFEEGAELNAMATEDARRTGFGINADHMPDKQLKALAWLRVLGFDTFDHVADATNMAGLIKSKAHEVDGALSAVLRCWTLPDLIGRQQETRDLLKSNTVPMDPKAIRCLMSIVNPCLSDCWGIRIAVTATNLKAREGVDFVETKAKHVPKRWAIHIVNEFLKWDKLDETDRHNVATACAQSNQLQAFAVDQTMKSMEGKDVSDIPEVIQSVTQLCENPNDLSSAIPGAVSELLASEAQPNEPEESAINPELAAAVAELDAMTARERTRSKKKFKDLAKRVETLRAVLSPAAATGKRITNALNNIKQHDQPSNWRDKLATEATTMATNEAKKMRPDRAAAYAMAMTFAKFCDWIHEGATPLDIVEHLPSNREIGNVDAIRCAGACIEAKRVAEIARAGDDVGAHAWASYLYSPPNLRSNKREADA